MNVEVPIKIVRNIVKWCIENEDGKRFTYSKQFIKHLNYHINEQDINIQIPTIMVGELLKYCEYLVILDKLGKYDNFYDKLKRLTN